MSERGTPRDSQQLLDLLGQGAPSEDLVTRIRAALGDAYEVKDLLGSGGMALVFRAFDRRHGRDVAVKVMRPELGAALADDRFLQEIQITARLQHPNIVALFDSGRSDGLVYYVMPLVEGESLRALLDREGRLGISDVVRITRELASALEYAHRQGVVHRDIKPGNILLSSGHAMLADFGVAGAATRLVESGSITGANVAIGTPAYMSPEQCTGGSPVDRRSDIYSLGCVLYEMLVGEPPFTGPTPQAIMARHAGERVPSLEVVRPDIPPHLIGVARKALAKVPADRYQTATELAAALEVAAGPGMRLGRWLAAAGSVAVVAAVILWLLPSPPTLDPQKVVIFPLEERGLQPGERGVGGDVAVMISTALEHADPLLPLDVRDRLTDPQRADPGLLSPEQRLSIARQMAAAYYVTGVIQGHGDSATVGLRLYDARGDSLMVQRSATGHRRGTPTHHLGIDALIGLLPSLVDPGRKTDLEPLRRRNPSAIALYVQGEREYRLARFPSALDFYRRALTIDSGLAIAAIKGALAAYWQDHRTAAELATYAADRHQLLPPRYAAFARGLKAFTEGQADSAESWLLRALSAAPGWPEAAMQLGEVYYHLVPMSGHLDSLAAARFQEAVAADSGFGPPLVHLAEIAIGEQRLDEARRLVRRFAATAPSAVVMDRLNLMLGCATEGSSRFSWEAAVRAQPGASLGAAKALAVAGRHLRCAEGAFQAVLSAGPDSLKWGAAFGLQSVWAAQRRTSEVIALVDSVVGAGVLQVLMTAYIVDVAAGLPVDSQAEAVARFGVQRWGKDYGALAGSRHLDWLKWLFGVWHARQGDSATVESLRRILAEADAADPNPVTHQYADALAAHGLLLARDTTAAIAALHRLEPGVPSDSLTWSMALPLAVERARLAELLFERKEYSRAIEVASIFDHPEPLVYVAFLPFSLELRNRAAEALGRRREADRYRAKLEHLSLAGPSGRPS